MATNSVAAAPSPAAPSAGRTAAHVAFLDYFRATSILAVVLIHAGNVILLRSLDGADTAGFSAIRTGVHLLAHNSTIYFAAISGILYAYTLHRKPHGVFMRSRFTNVALPYALVSIALTVVFQAYAVIRHGSAFAPGRLFGEIVYNVLLGEAWNTLWYIPVVMVLYVISPWLLILVRDRKYRILAWLIALSPLVISRTGTAVTPSMIGYFIGTYTVGLMIGSDLAGNMDRFRRHQGFIAVIAALSALAIVALDRSGIDHVGPTSLRESGFYVLRLSLTAMMLVWLEHWPWDRNAGISRVMDMLARYAFGIYFIHGPLLRPIAKAVGVLLPANPSDLEVIAAIAAAYVAACVISLGIVTAIVQVTGPYSKWIIGAAAPARTTA